MIGSLILSSAGTAGLLTAEGKSATDSDAISSSDKSKLWKSVTQGPLGVIGVLRKMAGKALGIVGINLSVASLLRQSQVFTGLFGSFMQIIGAFVDITLAPLMPKVFQFFKWLIQKGPAFAELMERLFSWLGKATSWIINQIVNPILKAFGKDILEWEEVELEKKKIKPIGDWEFLPTIDYPTEESIMAKLLPGGSALLGGQKGKFPARPFTREGTAFPSGGTRVGSDGDIPYEETFIGGMSDEQLWDHIQKTAQDKLLAEEAAKQAEMLNRNTQEQTAKLVEAEQLLRDKWGSMYDYFTEFGAPPNVPVDQLSFGSGATIQGIEELTELISQEGGQFAGFGRDIETEQEKFDMDYAAGSSYFSTLHNTEERSLQSSGLPY